MAVIFSNLSRSQRGEKFRNISGLGFLTIYMIPKKIHYTWFSNDPYPVVVKHCMDTWEAMLPGYEFVHWDMRRISGIDNLFLQQALEAKKWAFAADFVRLYALYTEGGIYLDTDVEVYKNFDDLLHLRAFIGKEGSYHVRHSRAFRYLTSHCMGAEAGHPFIKSCLEYYRDRPFVLSHENWLPDSLKYDQTILPFIQTEIAKLHGYHPSEKVKQIQNLNDGVRIFPYDWLDCNYRTKNSYCRHLAMRSWHAEQDNTGGKTKEKLKQYSRSGWHHIVNAFGYAYFKKM